jgi:hypothetical protein
VAYTGNGATTAFAFGYKFLTNADLKVYQAGTLKTITTHYTVSGAGNDAGGTVTFLTAPTNGQSVVIIRDPALTQGTDLVENDPLPAETLEDALDKLTIIAQRLDDRLDRAVILSDTETAAITLTLPSPVAGYSLVWNATADGLDNSASDTVADAAAAAASAAAAAASAAAAAASAAAALSSEVNAQTAETNAETAETNAELAEANAVTARLAAEVAQAAAELAKTAAETAETNAETAETNAETAETNAAASATLAQNWAVSTNIVAATDYSAKQYAIDAAASAVTAAGFTNGDYGLVTDAVGTTSDYGTVP